MQHPYDYIDLKFSQQKCTTELTSKDSFNISHEPVSTESHGCSSTNTLPQPFSRTLSNSSLSLQNSTNFIPSQSALSPTNYLFQEKNIFPELYTPSEHLFSLNKKDAVNLYHLIHFSPLGNGPGKNDVLKSTFRILPQLPQTHRDVNLPFVFSLRPFSEEVNFSKIELSESERCEFCRSFINPFVTINDGSWACSICLNLNKVPPKNLILLREAFVEFNATEEFVQFSREPSPACYIFLVDTSLKSFKSGVLELTLSSLISKLHSLPGDCRTRVAIITFDHQIHFYRYEESLLRPQKCTSPELEGTI
ncbi:protein transport protein Sec24B-like [Zophobas morio]|uniref:protein transport protein Sec24B-like n=1 Tax=Zophobas morio TaxID=2755281 RepID=UPI003082D592